MKEFLIGVDIGTSGTKAAVVNGQGQVLAQFDGPVQQGLYPADCWSPAEVVPDAKVLHLPADLTAGQYSVVLVAYNRVTGTPLTHEGSELLTLGSVKVTDAEASQ